MEINYASIGERVRYFRKAMRMTQAELGEQAQVEPSNISHIERGATKVSLPTLVKIANVLQASLDDLVCGSIEKNSHVSIKEIDALLSDCSDSEFIAIAEMIKSTKSILRKE